MPSSEPKHVDLIYEYRKPTNDGAPNPGHLGDVDGIDRLQRDQDKNGGED